ncbi:MAG: 50S ribosomal protein L11 methyltransferase [Desulfobacteraceae bacterium]|nr:50S ribosomal protein L11 methyltransferase [Desulfobacteraceae bacterium]
MPYDELFIYYLKGCLRPENEVFSDAYIGNWEEDGFSFLFFSRPSADAVARLLRRQPGLALIDSYQMAYADWQGAHDLALQTERLQVHPPWQTPPAGGRRGIVLDPGVVFGTGTHPTTRDCLYALEMLYSREAPADVQDLGTGTGLLALAAARLGARRTLAVDLNPLCARTAAANVRRNSLQNRVLVVRGRAEAFVEQPADLVIANIHFDVMRLLLRSQGFYRKRWFVLSGLLPSEARWVLTQLTAKPVEIIEEWHQEGVWSTFCGRTL